MKIRSNVSSFSFHCILTKFNSSPYTSIISEILSNHFFNVHLSVKSIFKMVCGDHTYNTDAEEIIGITLKTTEVFF